MADSPGTFHESWYRVRERRVALRPHVRLTRQNFRGERWYVLHDPFTGQFFRLRPAAHAFVSRLSRDRTVGEVWEACLERFPDDAPGQGEVIHLLAQLFHANLIQSDQPADSATLFERHRTRKEREVRSRLLNIMFARFHLLDPDRLLTFGMPLVRPLLGPLGWTLWGLGLLMGIKAVIDNAGELANQAQGLLAPGNLFLLYLSLILLKTVHEFGHAFVCRHHGGEVRDMGIMLLVFTPLPYVNATTAWSFRERWKRVHVGAAGIVVELFFGSMAAVVWASTGPGTVHAVAYNMLFIASVSTLLFNANPLLRYDGYYILSDLIDQPNLHGRAGKVWRHIADRRLLGLPADRATENPSTSRKETVGLAVFGAASAIYRIMVFSGILLFVGSRFLLIGVLMAAVCAVSWIVTPLVKLFRFLAASPHLHRHRARAVTSVSALLAGILLLIGGIPVRVAVVVPGVVHAENFTEVSGETSGFLDQVLVPTGSPVEAGTPLVRLNSPDLEFIHRGALAQLSEVETRIRAALDTHPDQLIPLRKSAEAVRARLGEVERQLAARTIRARHAGIWEAPELDELKGAWIPRGMIVGHLLDERRMSFRAVVGQQDASRLYGEKISTAGVRLRGQAGRTLTAASLELLPGERVRLPSPALGWFGGGEVAVTPDDPEGLRTTEPFFELHAHFNPADHNGVALRHGRTGRLQLRFGREPVLKQAANRLRQLLQERYQL